MNNDLILTESEQCQLFRGYIKTKNKKAIEKFMGVTDLRTYNDVRSLSEFAGVLADDIVLIDIDDSVQADILFQIVKDKQLKCKVNQTTRGKHFFFKNNGKFTACKTHIRLACGLTADIKLGSRNSIAILKYNGVERATVLDCDQYEQIPSWLQPVASSVNFLDMKNGDGRDTALFAYILTLQSNGFSKEECIKTLNIINDYVLADKLSKSDIERITRDDAFKKELFFEKNTFLFNKFALYLESELNIKRIEEQLYIYSATGDYKYVDNELLENAIIHYIPGLKSTSRNEVIKYLRAHKRTEELTFSPPKWINFKNGLLDLETLELIPHTADLIVPNQIPFNYDPDAYDELTDKTLDKISCNNKSIRALLEEMAGSCLYRAPLNKAFILTGEGSNGKSTYLNLLKRMLGKQNISVLDMKKLNDRFSTVMMYRKLANIGDDISDSFIDDSADFKKIVTGETISAEYKGQNKFDFEPYCTLIFSANHVPRFKKAGVAIARRFVILPFNAQFKCSDRDYDPFIEDKLSKDSAVEYMIMLAVKALHCVIVNGKQFTSNKDTEELLEQFLTDSDPLQTWLDNHITEYEVIGKSYSEVRKMFNDWCESVDVSCSINQTTFGKELKRKFNLDSNMIRKGKDRVYIYKKKAN